MLWTRPTSEREEKYAHSSGSCYDRKLLDKEPKLNLSPNLAKGASFKLYFVSILCSVAENKKKNYPKKRAKIRGEMCPNVKTEIWQSLLNLLELGTGKFSLGIPG